MLLVDTKAQRIIADEECKEAYAAREPYGEWLDRNLLHIEDLKIPNRKIPTHTQEMRDRLYKVFGYSYEDVKSVILPMAQNGIEQTASMGHDVPLAVLSKQHQLLFNYFKQLFAQVTNPPIDALREKSRTCSCSSNCLIDWLTADCEINRFCAAAEIFPMRATS